MSSLTLESLSKKYGDTQALNSVSIRIEGGCTAILGPNGAGKTTMMKLITRIARPTSGSISINGNSLKEFPELSMKSIGSLVEQPEFYSYLTAREILTFVCRIKGIAKNGVKEEIDRVAELCSISTFLDRKSGGYSRGMKQRLGLAAALVSEPDILILDEPTFGLDPKGIIEMRKIIGDYGRRDGKTVLLSTHLISEATEICDRIVILDHGLVKYDSSLESHTKKLLVKFEEPPTSIPQTELIAGFTRKDELTAVFELLPSSRNSELIHTLNENGSKIRSVVETLGIEDIYMSIMNANVAVE